IFQDISGRRVAVKGGFKLLTTTSYRFDLSSFDPAYALVIDPTLLYSTYLGGSAGNSIGSYNGEVADAVAVDAFGNAYVTARTVSNDFPVTPGAFETVHNGGTYAGFVSKLNTTGSTLVYSTYFTNTAFGVAEIAVNGAGNAYVTGKTDTSGLFPTTANAYSQS